MDVEGFDDVNLADDYYGFAGIHYDHSREFRSNNVREWRVWNAILLGINGGNVN